MNFKSLFGSSNKAYYGEGLQNRFRSVLCSLVRSLAVAAPVVLLLTGFLRADTAVSIELVGNLMHEEHTPLLILGSHRCDLDKPLTAETTSDPKQVDCIACMQMMPFVATMKSLQKESVRDNLRMRTMALGNLDVASVSVLLNVLMHQETEQDTLPMAQLVIHRRTGTFFTFSSLFACYSIKAF